MGKKGAKLTGSATEAAEAFAAQLLPLGAVTSKKMFGGYGIFEAGTMFALVDSAGGVYLKASEGNREQLEAAGAERHGRMPYYRIPAAVLADSEQLLAWARTAIDGSKAA